MKEPKIKYPCKWTYTIIGDEEGPIRKTVEEVFSSGEYEFTHTRKSAGGKYISISVQAVVSSEEERNSVYSIFCKAYGVKVVL